MKRRRPKTPLDEAAREVTREIEHGVAFAVPSPQPRPPRQTKRSGLRSATLRSLVREAARRAFTKLRAQKRDERFYAFALYATEHGASVVPSANTEEGLARRVRSGRKGDAPGAEERRWLAPEWAYHGKGNREFTAVAAHLASGPALDALSESALARQRSRRLKACADALKDLDREGFFGEGRQRDRVTLLVSGDDVANDQLVEIATQLNPTPAAARIRKALVPPSRRRR